MTIKEKIGEIEEASEKLLVPKHDSEHVIKELFNDLLAKTTTIEEVEELEKKYKEYFDGDQILDIIRKAKLAKGFTRE